MAFQVLQRYGYEDESHHGQVQRETGTPSRPLVQFRMGGALKIPRICFPGASCDASTRQYAGRGKNAPTIAIAVRDDTAPAVRCDAISRPYLRAKGHNPVNPVSAQDSIDSQVRDEEVDAITRAAEGRSTSPVLRRSGLGTNMSDFQRKGPQYVTSSTVGSSRQGFCPY